MKKLHLYFLSEEGKHTSIQPKAAKEDLSVEQVKTFMNGVVATGIFEVAEMKKYAEVASAKYVETITTQLF